MAEKRVQLVDIIEEDAKPEDRFIIIDDSLIGAQMALERGIPIIMVATGRAAEQELRSFAPHVFSDFGENRWQRAVEIIKNE